MHKLSHHFNLFLQHFVNLFLVEKMILLVWNYFKYQAGEDEKLINFVKVICCIVSVCGKKLLLAKGVNMYNLLACLRRHHLKQYIELIEAQEKYLLNTVI